MKTYKVVYKPLLRKQRTIDCSEYSLQKYLDRFAEEGSEVLSVVEYKQKQNRKPKDINKVKKAKYYDNQYSNYYRYYKNGKIDEATYERIKAKLKELKRTCKTLREYQHKFEEYKKSTNTIPPYNVSD